MDADYPAAHSMDTLFFAVDKDGHVAVFDTGEAGALPDKACSRREGVRLQQQLATVLPQGDYVEDFQGRCIPGRPESRDHRRHVFGTGFPLLLFLESPEPIRELIDSGRARQVPTNSDVLAFFVRELPEADFERLHQMDLCRGCFFNGNDEGNSDEEETEGMPPRLAAHGLYQYSHLTENWVAGPYGRKRVPLHPIHVDELPPEVRRQVKTLVFDSLRFAEAPYIQPVEHVPCVAHDCAYLDVTGRTTRPIPGREEEYAEIYETLDPLEEPPEDEEDGE